jgi:hypothetical protein
MTSLLTTLIASVLAVSYGLLSIVVPTTVAPAKVPLSHETATTPTGQGTEISETNWQQHPQIRAIRKIVTAVSAGLKNGSFKTQQRKFESCADQYFTLRRIARDAKGAVAWYEEYSEGEDSSWDYHQYYDQTQRLRFVLVTVYAANGTREQHRFYFDETGKLVWQNRRRLKGPGYFAPSNVEELVKEDPAREFANDEGCTEIKPKPRHRRVRTT